MSAKHFTFGYRQQLILLILLALALHVNTLFNDYVLDDIVVMSQNTFVQKGFKGIPEILTTDYVKGYSSSPSVLSGARYRPLLLISFAIEHQFFGASPFVSHLINILLFALLVALLFNLLNKYIFHTHYNSLSQNSSPPSSSFLLGVSGGQAAFISCLLFIVHPIHTEVIANVKSRDEILTFIFLIVSLTSFIHYIQHKKTSALITSLTLFLFALLTKETAVTFIAVLPLVLYFFHSQTLKKSILFASLLLIPFFIYFALRYAVVGISSVTVTDVTNSPYIYATYTQAFATKIFVLFKYISLLFIPHPLSSDYGYNQIPYISITSLPFILSFIVTLGLFVYSLIYFQSKSILSFCILFFFITLSLGTNLIIDLGAPLAERMLFQPSLAFCIIAAIAFLKLRSRSALLSVSLLLTALLLFSFKTITRNAEWKNNETLFFTDVVSSPQCSRLNLYTAQQYLSKANLAASADLKDQYLRKAVYYGEQSLKLHSRFPYAYLPLAATYFYAQKPFKTAALLQQALTLDTANAETKLRMSELSSFFYNQANGYADHNQPDSAILCYSYSVRLLPSHTQAWYNLGAAYYLIGDTTHASQAWQQVKHLDPTHPLNKNEFLPTK